MWLRSVPSSMAPMRRREAAAYVHEHVCCVVDGERVPAKDVVAEPDLHERVVVLDTHWFEPDDAALESYGTHVHGARTLPTWRCSTQRCSLHECRRLAL